MKKMFIAFFLLVALIGPACADDDTELQRLHLSQTEQQHYNQLVNSDKRHQFIITAQYLQYLRDIKPSIMYEDLGQIDGNKLSEMPQGMLLKFVYDRRERSLLLKIKTDQAFTRILRMRLADDDINLKKLSLSPEEQNAYQRIESNNDLHKFVVTRTYLNLIMPLFDGLDVKQVEAKKCGDLPRDLSNKFVLQRKEKELLDKIRANRAGWRQEICPL